MIRRPTLDELATLRAIELAAGELFRPLGMDAIADDEPPSIEALREALDHDGLWIATLSRDVAGYIQTMLLDGNLHIEQVTVHPDHARRGVGARLIDHAEEQARALGLPALTLTTFADVPWNAPYYRRLGFLVLSEGELASGMRELVAGEAQRGLAAWPRVCMIRAIRARAHR